MSLRTAKAAAHEDSAPDTLPEVRLEVRQGSGRVHTYELGNLEFLIGSVPGCDLRLPGADLPPLFCLLTRHPSGLRLRKLAPTQLLLVNGETAHQRELGAGDRITVGATDIVVHVAPVGLPRDKTPPVDLQRHVLQLREQVARLHEERKAFEIEQAQRQREWEEKARRLDQEQHAVREEKQRLEALRSTRVEAKVPAASAISPDLLERERVLEGRSADVHRQQQELASVRQELADLRNQLYQRYQERRDRLSGLQEAVDRAARKVQEQKRHFDGERREWVAMQEAFAQKQALLEQRARELDQARQRLHEDRATWESNQTPLREELAAREEDLNLREAAIAQRVAELETKQRQYQADVLRLDRLQGTLAEREQEIVRQSKAVEQERLRVQQSSEELEAEVTELGEWRKTLQEEADRLKKQKEESDALARSLDQRSANLEGQQSTLAGLRTRLERMREELRDREQQLEEERAKHESGLGHVEQKHRSVTQREQELEQERELFARQRADWIERSATLESAVRHLKQAQEQIGEQERTLQQREADLTAKQTSLVEQERLLQARLEQVAQAQERLDAERTTLRERTQSLTQTEMAREGLQDSLRRRAEDLVRRQQVIDAQADDLEAQAKLIQEGRKQQEEQLQKDRQDLAQAREAWDKERAEFQDRSQHHLRQFEQLQEFGRQLAAQRKALAEERLDTLKKKEVLEQAQADFQAQEAELRGQVQELTRQLPEIELRAGTIADRLSGAREELRDHLTELHEFVRVSRRDLEQLGERLAEEERQLRLQEQELRQGQEEHRLALAAFRQQLLGWQGQIAEMKRLLAQDQSRLQIRQAEVEAQARHVDETSAQLAQKAEQLQHHEENLAEQRQEVDEHLHDMQAWYRKKMRDLAGIAVGDLPQRDLLTTPPAQPKPTAETGEDDAIQPVGANILSITDPGDRRLGETLREFGLVDDSTLAALLGEARRQRRTLRQVLLKSGVITLYQLALIEAGNVAGLMLGPVRLIDRLAVLAGETLYRVFDPRRGCEGLLRHLSEKDAQDAVRPDEFRERFRQAMLDTPHVAATWEVLDIAGRPAALQEWVSGVPSTDWPPLAAAPGVCYRLLTQAALGLAAAHRAGILHGHLHEGAFVLTEEGILKLTGLGEPPWLSGTNLEDEAADEKEDLRALGKVVSTWCSPSGVRRGAKTKPMPDALVSVLYKLASTSEGYPSADALLADLDTAGADLPANAEAWDRLLKYVREHATADVAIRRSA